VDTAGSGPIGRDTALVTRLVVVDAVLLALVAAYAVWVSRTNRGSHVNLFSGHRLRGREHRVGRVVAGVIPGGFVFGTARYDPGTRLLNIPCFSPRSRR